MNVKLFAGALLLLAAGNFIGRHGANARYLDGRLSACKDMTSVLNQGTAGTPLELQCRVADGEVYITAPALNGRLINLNGQEKS